MTTFRNQSEERGRRIGFLRPFTCGPWTDIAASSRSTPGKTLPLRDSNRCTNNGVSEFAPQRSRLLSRFPTAE